MEEPFRLNRRAEDALIPECPSALQQCLVLLETWFLSVAKPTRWQNNEIVARAKHKRREGKRRRQSGERRARGKETEERNRENRSGGGRKEQGVSLRRYMSISLDFPIKQKWPRAPTPDWEAICS